MVDERKLRLYRFLLRVGRLTPDDIPPEYRDELDGNKTHLQVGSPGQGVGGCAGCGMTQ